MGLLARLTAGLLSRRRPRPIGSYGLHEEVQLQLLDLPLDPDRPLVAVDADEVLVEFAPHLQRFAHSLGLELRLEEYKLDGSLFHADGRPASRETAMEMFRQFFDTQTLHQRAIPGAAEGLRALSRMGQVVILTNVPLPAREARIENLRALGMDYPLIANIGGKGRALRWLWDHSRQPISFIDDAAYQHQSAEKHAPKVQRVQFVGSPSLRALAGQTPHAHVHPPDWPGVVAAVRRHWRLAGTGS